jgi:hypothetical protein
MTAVVSEADVGVVLGRTTATGRFLPDADRSMAAYSASSTSDWVRPRLPIRRPPVDWRRSLLQAANSADSGHRKPTRTNARQQLYPERIWDLSIYLLSVSTQEARIFPPRYLPMQPREWMACRHTAPVQRTGLPLNPTFSRRSDCRSAYHPTSVWRESHRRNSPRMEPKDVIEYHLHGWALPVGDRRYATPTRHPETAILDGRYRRGTRASRKAERP